jgi:hypothetical protein
MAPKKGRPDPPVDESDDSTTESEDSEESSSEEEEEAPQRPPPPKKPLNEARLEQLRMAREKAVEARRRIGDVKRAEKALKERELQARIERVQALEKELRKVPKRKKCRRAPSPSSSSSSESSSGSEDYHRRSRRVKRAPAQAPPAAAPPVDSQALLARGGYSPRDVRRQHVHALAYGSLFPGAATNPYI